MSLSANVSEKAALIWAIADKLTGVYKPHEYGEVILPLGLFYHFFVKNSTSCLIIGLYQCYEKRAFVFSPFCILHQLACIAGSLAASAVKEARRFYPEVKLTLLLPYHPEERPTPTPDGFDSPTLLSYINSKGLIFSRGTGYHHQ